MLLCICVCFHDSGFITEIGESSQHPRVLTLAVEKLIAGSPTTLMIRSCYRPLMSAVRKALDKNNVLLTGSSGIGKSQFQTLLLMALISDQKQIVLDLEDHKFYMITSSGDVIHGTRGRDFVPELDEEETIYLFDARPETFPLACLARKFVSASPSVGIRLVKFLEKTFPNVSSLQILYMPPWKLEELIQLPMLVPEYKNVSESVVTGRFNLFGGSIRTTITEYVRDQSSSEDRLENAINSCGADVLDYIGGGTAFSDKLDAVTHALLNLIPTDEVNFTDFKFAFCSEYVANKVMSKMSDDLLACT